MRRPFSSTSDSVPSLAMASVTSFSTSAGDCELSRTSSRGAYCTPILTSTVALLVGR